MFTFDFESSINSVALRNIRMAPSIKLVDIGPKSEALHLVGLECVFGRVQETVVGVSPKATILDG